MALSDYLDLRTAVIEMVGNSDITDVFPRLVKFAETDFNRRLRTREMLFAETVNVVNGTTPLPTDFLEVIDLATEAGVEQFQLSLQKYSKASDKRGFFAINDIDVLANDGTYTFRYYTKVPTLTASSTTSNWLLAKHPELYLYGVAEKAAKHMRNVELAQMTGSLAEVEYDAVAGQEFAESYARARVRVAGPTP